VKRSGIADLPLHGGHVPPWLAIRMATLGTAIAESVMHHYGRAAFLSRLSDPFWFQALGTLGRLFLIFDRICAVRNVTAMPWTCPACGSVIRHSEIEEMPRVGAQYRCHICRLELVMDTVSHRLIVPPLGEATDRKPRKPKGS
jgi:hypothetical protein